MLEKITKIKTQKSKLQVQTVVDLVVVVYLEAIKEVELHIAEILHVTKAKKRIIKTYEIVIAFANEDLTVVS